MTSWPVPLTFKGLTPGPSCLNGGWHCPLDTAIIIGFASIYPLDSDLPGGSVSTF